MATLDSVIGKGNGRAARVDARELPQVQQQQDDAPARVQHDAGDVGIFPAVPDTTYRAALAKFVTQASKDVIVRAGRAAGAGNMSQPQHLLLALAELTEIPLSDAQRKALEVAAQPGKGLNDAAKHIIVDAAAAAGPQGVALADIDAVISKMTSRLGDAWRYARGQKIWKDVQENPATQQVLNSALQYTTGAVEPEHIVLALLDATGVQVAEEDRASLTRPGDGLARGAASERTLALLHRARDLAGRSDIELADLDAAIRVLGETPYGQLYTSYVPEDKSVAGAGKRAEEQRAEARINRAALPKLNIPLLTQLGAEDLVQLARDGKLPPMVGRPAETESVKTRLGIPNCPGVVVTGPSGVGKSAIHEGLAHQIAQGDAAAFEDMRLIRVEASELAAYFAKEGVAKATQALGEEIERARTATPSSRIVLVVDEWANLPTELLGDLKSKSARGATIRILGAATNSDYDDKIKEDAALERRYPRVPVEQATREQSIMMLTVGHLDRLSELYGVEIESSAIQMAIDLAPRHKPPTLPASALDWLDLACSFVRDGLAAEPQAIRTLKQEIEDLRTTLTPRGIAGKIDAARLHPQLTAKNVDRAPTDAGIDDLDPKTRKALGQRLAKLQVELTKAVVAAASEKQLVDEYLSLGQRMQEVLSKKRPTAAELDEVGSLKAEYDAIRANLKALPVRYYHAVVDGPAVAAAVHQETRIKLQDLKPNDVQIEKVRKVLDKWVIGQDHAKEQILAAIKLRRTGVVKARGPIGCFFFAGLTGTGKTELAKALAAALDYELCTYECNKMAERHAVAEIVGAPPGYVGFDNGSPLCNDARRTGGRMIALLDEAEKAHGMLWQTLMRPLDEGKMTDNTHVEADFTNAIFIATTNLCEDIFAQYAGDGKYTDENEVHAQFTATYEATITPPVRGRFKQYGPPIIFDPSGHEQRKKIVDLKIRDAQETNAVEHDRHFEMSEASRKWIMSAGFDPQYGGRTLAAVVNSTLGPKLADLVMTGKFDEGDYIMLEVRQTQPDKSRKDLVIDAAAALVELGPQLHSSLPPNLQRLDLGEGRTALIDPPRDRFFIEVGADDGPNVYGPYKVAPPVELVERYMTEDERAEYVRKKAAWAA